MFTQCPDCETFFRVTAADLEVADGRVRCSRCEAVFDARAHLHALEDDSQPALGSVAVAPAAVEPPVGDLFEGLPADAVFDAAALSADDVARRAEQALDDPASDAGLQTEGASSGGIDPSPPLALPVAGTRRRKHGDRAWTAAGALFALGLAGQLVHAYRETLAQHPRLGPLVSTTYASLDLPIAPPTDLGRIGVQRTEVTTHPLYDDVLMLSGVLTNDASFAQPLPLLRVRLEDRWGELVGLRLFEPAEYLRRAPERGARLEAGRPLAIALEIVDPGSAAVGYAVEPCLRTGGMLACHGDPRVR